VGALLAVLDAACGKLDDKEFGPATLEVKRRSAWTCAGT
jgi:hypothetical protein